ncbi:MAG: DUF2169 domain-containing protein [Deltaproteobacteria bacterium]|nr:DUF2169 domain-containing protein [Deltaproteobacteria bacterium]
MPDFEQHGYQGFWMPHRRLNGEFGVLVVIKRRYRVNTVEAICEPSDETPPVAMMAEFYDDADPPDVSVRTPSEIAPEKRYVDVMLRGTAFAPGGKPAKQFDVELRIPGVFTRKLRIFGNRKCVWYPPVKELTYKDLAKGEIWQWLDPDFTEPEPIDKLPLRYEYAYGGWAKLILSIDEEEGAEEAQAVDDLQEKRRQRKKEIEKELEAEEKAAKEPKKKAEKAVDDKAQKLADKAFADSGEEKRDGITKVVDADVIARLRAEDEADDGMKIASAFRLGQHLPDRPEDVPRDDGAAEGEGEGDGEAEAEAKGGKKKAPDPFDDFFSGSEKTSALNLADLAKEKELQELLHENFEDRRQTLKDEEGTVRDREHLRDIRLSGDDWAAQYIRQRPAKKKKEREKSEYPEMPCPTNPSGRGFAVNPREEAIADLPLPNIEDPENLLKPEGFVVELDEEFDLSKVPAPAGWAPYAMGWYPRAQYFGVYPWDVEMAEEAKKAAAKAYDDEDPDDKPIIAAIEGARIPIMHPNAWQEAHPKLWAKKLRGDEEIYLTNLTPGGHLFFRLPGLHPTCTIDMSRGPEPLAVDLDTLLIDLEDADKPAVEMCWRGWYKLRDWDELGEKPVRNVRIIEVDQVDWMDVKRDEAREESGQKKEQLTSFIQAITDEDEEAMGPTGEEARQRYREGMRADDDRLGIRKDDVKDAWVFNQTEDRRLYTDEWDDEFRAEKQGFIDEQKAKAEAEAELRRKGLKKQAREKADEEFGIIRDDDGSILVHDDEPPAPAPPKKKK